MVYFEQQGLGLRMRKRCATGVALAILLISSPSFADGIDVAPVKARKKVSHHTHIITYPKRPRCGLANHTVDILDDENAADTAFGCSVRQNLRVMVDKRHDLRRGRSAYNTDGERAAEIVKRYRNPSPASRTGSQE